MIKLNVDLAEKSYPIYIGLDFKSLGKKLLKLKLGKRIIVITDTNVDKLHSNSCIEELKSEGFEVFKYVILAGEKSKNLDTVKEIYEYLLNLKCDRNTTIIALGGGVVGDITGFVASTFLRGINFVQVPTSLLAQADSSVGGKVGVDFSGNKNIIGAFYQPELVYININTLKTLPERELKQGLSEVVKHGLIRDAEFFEYIENNVSKIFSYDENVLQYIIKKNCQIKAKVIQQDEKEKDIRAILNFGHTIGHAVESASAFSLLHGESISIGMVGACKIAEKLGMIKGELTQRVINLFKIIGVPIKIEEIDVEKIYNLMFFDKKIKNNKLTFILPKEIGKVLILQIDNQELIKDTLMELK